MTTAEPISRKTSLPLSKPPSIPQPPLKPSSLLQTQSLPNKKNINVKSGSNGIKSSPVSSHPLSPPSKPQTTKSKEKQIAIHHRFGTFILGSLEQNNDSATTKPNKHCILNKEQRIIFSKIVSTILSNPKNKKLPNYKNDAPYLSDRDSDSSANSDNVNNESSDQQQQSIDDDQSTFIDKALSPLKDKNANNDNSECTESILLSAEKENLILMTSILKYIDSESEMDTIHRACFNLWKDWYRCYGSIQNQFQTAFMAVCEQLLGNVDSRALKRDAPKITTTNTKKKSIEQITYDLSKQISTLKHAFAIEQLQHTQSSKKCKQSVPQIIDGMEPNVWRIVEHIVFNYLNSYFWVECKHKLFNFFLNQYETIHRKLDRDFISNSCFGVYTLICQICDVSNSLKSSEQKEDDTKNAEEEPMDDFSLMDADNDNDNNSNDESKSSKNENIEIKVEYDKYEIMQGLNWYYSVCRLENIMMNKRADHLSFSLYNLYKPVINPLFSYFDNFDDSKSMKILSLIESICDKSDYQKLSNKHQQLLRKEDGNNKEHNIVFIDLLSRIIDACITWICRDLYYNYRTSEFCMFLTQLLADPNSFKCSNDEYRPTRIIRLHLRFNLPSDQQLVNSYSCALDTGKFLHQGKIYFFKDYLCFYSNMLNIQKLLMPVTEIKAITRKVTAWVFNNAIQITMKDGRNFIFRTFMKRDATFELLTRLINGQIDWSQVEKKQQMELAKEREEIAEKREKERLAALNKEKMENDNDGKNNGLNKLDRFGSMSMSAMKNALSAIDAQSSKLLNTDTKSLLHSKFKDSSKEKVNFIPLNRAHSTSSSNAIEMKNFKKTNDAIYSSSPLQPAAFPFDSRQTLKIRTSKKRITATRSAPTSPSFSKSASMSKLNTKKSTSDSEQCDDVGIRNFDDLDSNSSNYSDISDEKETISQIKRESISLLEMENNNLSGLSREEMTAKCVKMDSMKCKFVYTEKPKVEKDFEQMCCYTFDDIKVDDFWSKFWSNDAVYSPIDWIKADVLNSNVSSSKWSKKSTDSEWYFRNVSCVTKLEDLPSFFPKSITKAESTHIWKYCEISPYFYVLIKVISVKDVPFADCYDTHQKIEFRQSAQITEDGNSIKYCTHLSMYFGVEWKKSTWLKSPIRSRTLQSIKADAIKYCEFINKHILDNMINNETPQKTEENMEKKIKKSSSKLPQKQSKNNVDKVNIKNNVKKRQNDDENVVMYDRKIEETEDYDFVFKVGNSESLIRCRVLLSCFKKDTSGEINTWLVWVLIILAVFVILFCLYSVSSVISLISSVLVVLNSTAMHLQQMSEHINEQKQSFDYLHAKESDCNDLSHLLSVNPSSNILRKTYESLNCLQYET